ncbi:MAG TPA: acyltransferase [Gemmataceae bacterium]|jgi:peptidoglycan/LPS O-acetylase OafA/YrhL|nr:acyltransferase [Gemmataceae bacterium]
MPTYLPWLDLLRFVACVLVILSHMNPFPENPDANHFGHNGVGLFFSISGYLIGSVLINGSTKPAWVSRFYANRLLRIYPPLLVGLVFFGTLVALGLGNSPHMWDKFVGNLPYYLTFTAQLSPNQGDPYAIVWTLCVEEYFYLLLPLAYWAVGPRWTAVGLVGVIIVLSEPGLRMLPGTQFGTWFLIPVNLLAGAILAAFRPTMREGRPWIGLLGLVMVVANGIFGWFRPPFGPVMGLVTTITVWSFAVTRMPVPRSMNWLVLCGKWSYGIYLVHLPFCSAGLRVAQRLGLDEGPKVLYFGVATLVATVGATVLAAAMYYVIERPISAYRTAVTDRPWARGLATAIQVSLVPIGLLYWLWVRSGR